MKTNITVSIDSDLVETLRKSKVNISETVNDVLRNSLKPKKVNLQKEDLTLNIIEFGKSLNLTPEMAVFTHENLQLSAPGIWQNFKDNYEPTFTLFDYMKIRNKFRKRFFENHNELNSENQS